MNVKCYYFRNLQVVDIFALWVVVVIGSRSVGMVMVLLVSFPVAFLLSPLGIDTMVSFESFLALASALDMVVAL